ncbi:MAG: peptidase C69 [Myxococcales bacterium]|nr:peptidase C69 [Myxococcales bacterium]|tara:strand:- start:515 stop:1951 length:1437 start_codon:yes stop_codon:yes gene_type:complete
MQKELKSIFQKHCPQVAFGSLRWVQKESEIITVRDENLEPLRRERDLGLMITLWDQGAWGYAATRNTSEAGVREAIEMARGHLERTANQQLPWPKDFNWPHPQGAYESQVGQPWQGVSLQDKVSLLMDMNASMKCHNNIVYRESSLWCADETHGYITHEGGEVLQKITFVAPDISVTAANDNDAQTRSMSGRALVRQGGFELIEQLNLMDRAPVMANDALALLDAPNCPSDRRHVLLMPDQMILQIHESIGHPLETDRILGDERNYAGTTFVTPEMFGSYQYGSKLLNVSFDPGMSSEIASYAFDDEGNRAQKQYLIKDGILECPMGSVGSMARSGLPGVANARATNWNRAPIDRMANLNLEPGSSSFKEMVSSVEKGVLMKTNRSWSIDDSRNKFQFGCEWGQLIENGELTTIVKNPNYRGVSANFWRNLEAVGDTSTFEIMGTPFCGKGEPNQVIRVGHASPTCLFGDVAVFGGEK